MPSRPCLTCAHMTPRRLDGPSEYGYVNYHCCDARGHVWTVAKDDPHGPARTVAAGNRRPRNPSR